MRTQKELSNFDYLVRVISTSIGQQRRRWFSSYILVKYYEISTHHLFMSSDKPNFQSGHLIKFRWTSLLSNTNYRILCDVESQPEYKRSRQQTLLIHSRLARAEGEKNKGQRRLYMRSILFSDRCPTDDCEMSQFCE